MRWRETLDDFKGFVKRGNVLDMAVGVVVGVAFSAVTNSIVQDLLMPVVGMITGGVDFKDLFVILEEGDPAGPYQTLAQANEAGAVTVAYGSFVNAVVNFLIITAAMFVVVRLVQRLNTEGEPESTPAQADPRRCPYCRTEIAEAATRCPACTSKLEDEE